jgi:hypothetical protein
MERIMPGGVRGYLVEPPNSDAADHRNVRGHVVFYVIAIIAFGVVMSLFL